MYQYDALDNLTCIEQRGNVSGTGCADPPSSDATSPRRVRRFSYNSLSQLLSAKNPESGTITYQYDNDGNLSAKIAPAPNQTGSATLTTTYDYDGLHRLKEKTYSDGTTPTVRFGYDGVAPSGCTPPTLSLVSNLIGNRSAMCDAAGGAAWSYDEMGRAEAVKQTILGVTKTISYEYNLAGLPTKITYPSGRVIDYEYNEVARAKVAKDVVNLVNYAKNATYTAHGALKTVLLGNDFGNGGSTLTQTFNKRLQPLTIHAANSTRTIIDLTYGFNVDVANNGNVLSITNNLTTGRNRSFTYDELNRVLTAATPAGPDAWSQSFEYDIWGNLKTITATGAPGLCVSVHPNNRLDSTCGGLTTYGHDSAGNLISEGTTTYTYNAENNLKTGGGVTFTYDGDGQRVAKSGYRLYWWGTNGNSGPLAETFTSGTDKREYIFFAGRRIATVDLSVSGGNCAGTPPNCARYYFYPDHLGSTSVLTSSSGNTTVHEADFYPFGGEKVITSSSISPHYKFTGKERDGETGLDYLGARYLGSTFGRLLSADPDNASSIGNEHDPQSWNGYAYARNNPLLFTDPTGEKYEVCQLEPGGNKFNCGEVSDRDFEKLQKDGNLQISGGKIHALNADGSRTLVGTYQELEPDLTSSAEAIVGNPVFGHANNVVSTMFYIEAGALSAVGAGIAYGAVGGGSALGLWNVGRFVTGQLLTRVVHTPLGNVIVQATIEIVGDVVVLKNFSVFPQGGGKVAVGTAVLKAAFNAIKRELASAGFRQVIVKALRISGANAPRVIDQTHNLK